MRIGTMVTFNTFSQMSEASYFVIFWLFGLLVTEREIVRESPPLPNGTLPKGMCNHGCEHTACLSGRANRRLMRHISPLFVLLVGNRSDILLFLEGNGSSQVK